MADRPSPELSLENSGEQVPVPGSAVLPQWAKALVVLWGGMLALPMPALLLGFCCISTAVDPEDLSARLGIVTAILVGVCGGGMFWHGAASLGGKVSRPLRLPPAWALAGGFVVAMATALGLDQVRWATFPLTPWFTAAAALLLLLAVVAWAVDNCPERVTWRWAWVAFAAGATVSTALALILGWLIPYFILWEILDLGEPIRRALERFTALLAGREVARALTDPFFLLAMVQYAIATPLIEEFAKSLVVLPLIRRVSRREAFLLGAIAGAGFAFLENLVYASSAGASWSGSLGVRALGAAVHSLCTGLAALAWHALLWPGTTDRTARWRLGVGLFGIALAVHGIWNGSILLWSALSGTPFFGVVRYTRVIGTPIAVGLLALLAVEGAAAAWGLRTISRAVSEEKAEARRWALPEVPVERAIALWAVVCLVVLLPLGLALLRRWWGR